jgi:glycosyltransferase involved in cell wall biosynthesis
VNSAGSATAKVAVTVLINAYNYGRFIEAAIDSALAQDFPAEQVEVLVVDDGSTDDTAERVRKYGESVRYFYKANGGQASAFNLGFAKARGEIVAFLDADDYFLPNKLRRVVDEFQNHPEVGMIYHSLLELDSKSGGLHEAKIVPISGFVPADKSKLLEYCIYPTSSMAFRRAALGRLLPMPETLRIQADAYVSVLIPLLTPVLAIKEHLSVYRIHGQNAYHSQGEPLTPERRTRRIGTLITLSKELRGWAKGHREFLISWQSRVFLSRWLLGMEEERFEMEPPSRFAFFWFLLRQNYAYAAAQTLKFTTYNYAVAPLALLLGYGRKKLVYEWRGKAQRAIQSLFGRPSSTQAKEGHRTSNSDCRNPK